MSGSLEEVSGERSGRDLWEVEVSDRCGSERQESYRSL